jgi:O-antigen/teichoic acid export membrane protein
MTAGSDIRTDRNASRFGARRVHRDAGAMALSSVANAALGLAFWAFAARFIVPAELGVMTAVLAVVVSVGGVVAVGVGDAYTALLPAVGAARPRVYRRGQRVFVALAVTAGAFGALAATTLLREVRGSVPVAALVAVGVVAWAYFNLQNSTMMAIGRASGVPTTNIVLGLAKIILLPALAFLVGWHSVELAVVIATASIVLVMRPLITRIITTGDGLPPNATISEDGAVPEFHRVVARTLALSALGVGVIMLAPFLVTVSAGPTQGALFALSFSVVSTFDFIAASMAVSLVVHASSAPEQAATMARGILVRAGAVTILGTAGLVAVAPTALRILNPQYGELGAFAVISVLCAATVIRAPYIVWSALQQSRRALRLPLMFNAVTAALLLIVMPSLCDTFGAVGGALAVLVHQAALTAAAGVHQLLTLRARRVERRDDA